MCKCVSVCVFMRLSHLPNIADCILLCVDFCTDPPSPVSGLYHRVWRRMRNFIMQIRLRVRLLPCQDLLAFFLQRNGEIERKKRKEYCSICNFTTWLVKCNYWFPPLLRLLRLILLSAFHLTTQVFASVFL